MDQYVLNIHNNKQLFGQIDNEIMFIDEINKFLSVYMNRSDMSSSLLNVIPSLPKKCIICSQKLITNNNLEICCTCVGSEHTIFSHIECSSCYNPLLNDNIVIKCNNGHHYDKQVHLRWAYNFPPYKCIPFPHVNYMQPKYESQCRLFLSKCSYLSKHTFDKSDNFNPNNVSERLHNNISNMYQRYIKITIMIFLMARKTDCILDMLIDDVIRHIIQLIY